MASAINEHEVEQVDIQFNKLPAQIKIYNRNFHLRRIRHEELEQEFQKEIHQMAEKPKLTHNSYLILVQKLEQELNQLLQTFSNQSQMVDYQSFQTIVIKLGKFDELANEKQKHDLEIILTQLWLLLIEYDLDSQMVDNHLVEGLLNILFCPHTLKQAQIVKLLEMAFPDLQHSRIRYIEQYPETRDEVLHLEGIVKLWLKIRRNYFNHKSEKKQTRQNGELTFQPKINQKSRQFAERSLQKYLAINGIDNIGQSKLNELSGYISAGQQLSYHQILYKRGLEKEQMLKTKRQQQQPILEKEKSLTNEEVKRLVSNLYIKKQKRQDVDFGKIKEEEQLKLCTFKPQTISYHRQSSTPTIKNFQKDIQRFQKARREKQKLTEAYQNLGRVKQPALGPPSFVEREKPRLILQIKVGERIEQLRLKGDEQPRLVAKKFIHKHGLQQEMQQVLESVIEQQLAAL